MAGRRSLVAPLTSSPARSRRTPREPATIAIDIEGCKGCVLCVDVCPPRVLVMSDDVNAKGYRFPRLLDGCTGCELCAHVCPDFVIDVYRGIVAEADT